jgi:hypothetical protein
MKVALVDPGIAVVKSFRKHYPHIHSFHIRQQRNPILKRYAPFYYPLLFSVMYPKNTYANWLVSDSHLATVPSKTAPNLLCRNVCFGSQGDDMGSGMSIADMKGLLKQQYDVILFEWYKTLSVLNYINGGKNDDATFTEVAQFNAGTQERFDAMRAMFAELRRRGTKVYILSDCAWINPAEPNLFDFFLKTIQQFDEQIKKEDLIYSDDKVKTMRTNPILSKYCRKRRMTVKRLKTH